MNDEIDINDKIRELEEGLRKLQAQVPNPAVQSQIMRLQSELFERRGRPAFRPREPVTTPTPLPVDLSDEERIIWDSFLRYHAALLTYAGEVDRDQWIALLATAGHLTNGLYTVANGSTTIIEED